MSTYTVETLPKPLRERRIVSARLDAFTLCLVPPVDDDDDDDDEVCP
jgi:hypothetical protein